MESRENIINLVKNFIFITFTFQIIQCQMNSDKAVFQFPEYDYKETSKNVVKIVYNLHVQYSIICLKFQELTFREYEASCDSSSRCSQLHLGVDRTKCVRECISPSCYYDIYRFDEVKIYLKICNSLKI